MADTSFVTAVTGFGSLRSNATENVGLKWSNTSGATVTITQLGRWVVSGNSLTHTLTLWNSSGVLQRTVVVNCAGAPVGQFLYGSITPFDVASGTSIYVTSSELNGGDQWYNNTNTAISILSALGPVQSAYVSPGSPFDAGNNGGTYTSAGPVSFQFSSPSYPGWTKAGTIYDTNGYPYAVRGAVADATAGDTIQLPIAGAFTWGNGGSSVTLNKAITFDGRGTTITIASTGPTFGNGTIVNSGGARITNTIFQQPASANGTTAISATGANWRIDHCTYHSFTTGSNPGYFIYASAYGLGDHNTINTTLGNDEYLFVQGPSNSWTTANSLGTANAVFMEDNTITGPGYNDFNRNARGVMRFNLFTGQSKIDSHGYLSNSPGVGVRQTEAYYNTFTAAAGNYSSLEIRGGLFMGMFNTAVNPATGFTMTDYGFQYNTGNWGVWQTPSNYPLFFQIGTGQMTSIPVTSLVAYQRCQVNSTGTTTDWRNCGAATAAPSSGTQFTATGPGTGDGTAYVTPATEKAYVFGNARNGSVWPIFTGNIGAASTWLTNAAGYAIGATSITIASQTNFGATGKVAVGDAVAFAGDTGRYRVTASTLTGGPSSGTITIAAPGLTQAIAASAVTMTSGPLTDYQQQTGNSSATFTGHDIILSNRDYFADAGAGPNTGVTVGTAAQMALATPTLNHGFWVTNEGSWNTQNNQVGTPGYQKGQGRLYVGSGATWDLYYEPYTYPHPLQGTFPTLVSATVDSVGTTLTLVWSESCTTGAGGNGGVTVTPSGGAATATYSSGSGSDTYVYTLSRSIVSGETITVSYVQPGDGIESTAAQIDVASFSDSPVTNGSSVSGSQSPSLRAFASLGAGF